MRAARLLNLVLILQNGGRFTASELAIKVEVSERTILRDLEVLSGAGVPVYGTRGPGGGFELLDTFQQSVPSPVSAIGSGMGRLRRVRVRLSPGALQVALLNGRPESWRPRRDSVIDPQRSNWIEGSFRFTSYESAITELLALGPEVEVLLPEKARKAMAAAGLRIASLNDVPTSR